MCQVQTWVHEYLLLCGQHEIHFQNHIYIWFCLLFLALLGPHCCTWAFSSYSAQASHCGSISCCRSQALEPSGFGGCSYRVLRTDSVVVVQRLSRSVACGFFLNQWWKLSFALASGFFTTEPPGKLQNLEYLLPRTSSDSANVLWVSPETLKQGLSLWWFNCAQLFCWAQTTKLFVVLNCAQLFCDCSPAGSSVHGISQARIPEWVTTSFSRGSSQPRDQTHISCIGRRILYHWATWKACSEDAY